jgi:hypothetical protein
MPAIVEPLLQIIPDQIGEHGFVFVNPFVVHDH